MSYCICCAIKGILLTDVGLIVLRMAVGYLFLHFILCLSVSNRTLDYIELSIGYGSYKDIKTIAL